MTKFKTLKDIEMGIDEYNAKFIKNLKAEVVKWVKSDKTDNRIKEWAKYFFNLTKEDLGEKGK